ncbi:class I SAM-dependent methyltransferase [Candidatus Oscillochloris fontis]|uniref:class I SAM-dependent methyltransferase n=1 Tax=Candidatus Oscillochloris fontis TaxID=2496868 RepID=UPI001375C686|nr:class I SAM-dependent methyltransferase [Candidatus Oscillochloris fontis]
MIPIHAGGLDWLAIWRQMYLDERAQGESKVDPIFAEQADYWASQAKRFATWRHHQSEPDGFMQALIPRLLPTDTVMDIGAGTGRYLPVLSPLVREVIAIEPSPSMRAEMEHMVAELGLSNVTIRGDEWPMETPIKADVVISSHVLYSVADVAPFLLAMDQAAQRGCYLYLGLRSPGASLAPVWEYIHGQPRLALPGALEALACLHQLGLPAALELLPITNFFRFASPEEGLSDIRIRLRLTPQPERDARIMAAIEALFVRDADGMLTLREQLTHTALVSWQPRAQRQRHS